jgi:hypothetical protein
MAFTFAQFIQDGKPPSFADLDGAAFAPVRCIALVIKVILIIAVGQPWMKPQRAEPRHTGV